MNSIDNPLHVFKPCFLPQEEVKAQKLATMSDVVVNSCDGEKQLEKVDFKEGDLSSSVPRISEAEMDSRERQLHAQVVMQPSIVPEDKPIISVRSTNVPYNMALAVPTESPVNSPLMLSTEECTNESSQFSNSKSSDDLFLYQNEANEDLLSFCDIMNLPDCLIDEILENNVASSEPGVNQLPSINIFKKTDLSEVNGEVLKQDKPFVYQGESIEPAVSSTDGVPLDFSLENPLSSNDSTMVEDDEIHSFRFLSPSEIELLKTVDENMDQHDLPFFDELSLADKDPKQCSDPDELQIPQHQIMSDTLSWIYLESDLAQIPQTFVLDNNQTHDDFPLKSNRKRCFGGSSDGENAGKRMKIEIPPIATAQENKENIFQIPQKKDVKQNVAYIENPVYKMDSDGDLPLHIAVFKGKKEHVKFIIQLMQGKMLDARNENEQTPLHLALYLNDPEMIKILLKAGVDPCITDGDGNNLMHLVSQNSSQVFYDIVLHKMIDPQKYYSMMKARNCKGLTPMHIAVQRGNLKMIKLLLKEKVDLNVKDMKTGSTPLIFALEHSNWDLAQILIEHGADINIPTNSGHYPLKFVLTTTKLDLATYSLKHNAESGIQQKEMKNLFETEMRKRRRKRTTK